MVLTAVVRKGPETETVATSLNRNSFGKTLVFTKTK